MRFNQKLRSNRPYKHHINIEKGGNGKNTTERGGNYHLLPAFTLHHGESLYLAWQSYRNTTIMLSDEPLQAQLSYLHMCGIRNCHLCSNMDEEFRDAHTCLLLHKWDLHTCIIHVLVFECLLSQMFLCMLSFSAPIFERSARHVCSVAVNNSLGVGNAALLWRKHPLHFCNVTVFTCTTRQHWSQLCST